MFEKTVLAVANILDSQIFYDMRASEFAPAALCGRAAIRAARRLGYNGGWLTRYQTRQQLKDAGFTDKFIVARGK